MRLRHNVNHGWSPNRNDPEWERRVEREANITTDAAEAAYRRLQARLERAKARLERAAKKAGTTRRQLAELEAAVEARRQELLAFHRMMTQHAAPSTSRGRKSFRGVTNGPAF